MLVRSSKAILNLLDEIGLVEDPLRRIIQKGCVRILDAGMIIEYSFKTSAEQKKDDRMAKQNRFAFVQLQAIEQLLKRIPKHGIGPYLQELTGLFGSVMLSLSGNEDQQKWVENWVASDLIGSFLMTDTGGPNLLKWKSELLVEEKYPRLIIDKIHAISAHKMGFAIIVVRRGTSFIPLTFLIGPDGCEKLNKQPVGERWFDGNILLGNVKGEIPVRKEDQLTRGGLTCVNTFLTLCRPRLVRAIIGHVYWMVDEKRIELFGYQKDALENLLCLSTTLSKRNYYTRDSVGQVLSLKFACNEILIDIVANAGVPDWQDQRDLMGLSKMEGSSYRCYFEMHSKRGQN